MENLSFPCPFALVRGVQSFSPFSQEAGFLHEPQVLPPKAMSGQGDPVGGGHPSRAATGWLAGLVHWLGNKTTRGASPGEKLNKASYVSPIYLDIQIPKMLVRRIYAAKIKMKNAQIQKEH